MPATNIADYESFHIFMPSQIRCRTKVYTDSVPKPPKPTDAGFQVRLSVNNDDLQHLPADALRQGSAIQATPIASIVAPAEFDALFR